MFVDFYGSEIVHWLGTPYQVESHFNGAFLMVSDMDDEVITSKRESRILEKYIKFKKYYQLKRLRNESNENS